MARSTAALHETVAIQHRMDGTFGRNLNTGKSANQALANLTSSPGSVFALHVQDIVFHLKRKVMGIVTGTPAPVRKPLSATFLLAIEDLVAVLGRDRNLSAASRYRLAG